MKKISLLLLIITQVLHLNAQNPCNSVSYTIGGGQVFNVTLNTPGLMIDSMDVLWSVCNTSLCYTGTGTIASFQSILQTDTLKACYDAYIYINGTSYFCNECDSLVYNGISWGLLGGNPTVIRESSPYLISEFYPNPAKEIVRFDYYLNKPTKLVVMDILGNEVKTIRLSERGAQKINISDLSKGIYFGNVVVNNETIAIKKLIVR